MQPRTRVRLSQRRERAHRLQDLAATLEASADEHDASTRRLLRRMAEQLQQVALVLVPEDYPSADDRQDGLGL